jgi:hypothetical protein
VEQDVGFDAGAGVGDVDGAGAEGGGVVVAPGTGIPGGSQPPL